MKIKIIAVGKIKEKYLKDGIAEYVKRIQPYSDVEIFELNDYSIYDSNSIFEIEKAKTEEGKSILKNIKNTEYVITLDLNKNEPNSLQFATILDKSFQKGGSKITFVIGGSYGLSEEVRTRANDSISLSKLTFLHQMTRLILLEQIYRSFKILNNEVYHK
ncbi:MAG: 23S rRNA (pseudouridine(1915)-N(3))-methyltransferase RlmH [Bacilli bacterium]|nr:23S rRNA (pseudouridine(1915)-N(3))-methyltransferase RlmH [Bacilli bacterium]